MSALLHRLWPLWLALTCLMLLVRLVGVLGDVLYSPTVATYLAAGAVGMGIVTAWAMQPLGENSTYTLAQPGTLLAAAAAILAVTGGMNALLPVVPASITTQACPTARVRDVPYLATTLPDLGVNARAGAARNADPVGRYPGGCTIGFDGYCVGEPIDDLAYLGQTSKRLDSRWLRVAQSRDWRHPLAHMLSGEPDGTRFVSSGRVTVIATHGRLRKLPPTDCGAGSGDVADFTAPLPTTATNGNPVDLTPTGIRLYDYGAAVWLGGNSRSQSFRQVDMGPDGRLLWKAGVTATQLREKPAPVLIAVTACLAPGVPPELTQRAKQSQIGWATLDRNGVVTPTTAPPPSRQVRETLINTACQGLP